MRRMQPLQQQQQKAQLLVAGKSRDESIGQLVAIKSRTPRPESSS